MRDPNGTVTVAGFYDRVRDVPAEELARLNAVGPGGQTRFQRGAGHLAGIQVKIQLTKNII